MKLTHSVKRKLLQIIDFGFFNPYIGNFAKGRIYQGKWKNFCNPGMNCYSCPAARLACPIGAMQAVSDSMNFNFSFYVVGIILAIGAVLDAGSVIPLPIWVDSGDHCQNSGSERKTAQGVDLCEVCCFGAVCSHFSGCHHKLCGHRETNVLRVHLSGGNIGRWYPPASDAPGFGASDWCVVFSESGDFAGNAGGMYVHSPLLLQTAMPLGGHLWVAQQGQSLSSECGQGTMRPLRQVCKNLSDGCRSHESAQQL